MRESFLPAVALHSFTAAASVRPSSPLLQHLKIHCCSHWGKSLSLDPTHTHTHTDRTPLALSVETICVIKRHFSGWMMRTQEVTPFYQREVTELHRQLSSPQNVNVLPVLWLFIYLFCSIFLFSSLRFLAPKSGNSLTQFFCGGGLGSWTAVAACYVRFKSSWFS